jgi:DNA polymerase IV
MSDRTILHVDMDAFYASVEVLLDPTLAGKPLIVGGDGPRGVVASCSYEARAFGIRSAMASVQAKRLCPHAVFVRGNHGLYAEYSARIHEIFATFTPLIEGIALDEAFLDVTGGRRLFGGGAATASAVREAVHERTGLSCAVGVASNKLLAKLASKEAKPPIPGAKPRASAGLERPTEGVAVVLRNEELTFLHPLPVRALWGVGPKTFERLQRFGVATIGDLAKLPQDTLVRALGSANGSHLHKLSQGVDDRPVEPERPVKSIGHEETFAVDHFELEPLERELLRMADAVISRARHAGVRGRTVQLKVKLADFRLITRANTPSVPVDSLRTLHEIVVTLLRNADVADEVARLGVRLIGVSVSKLEVRPGATADAALLEGVEPANPMAEQLDLFGMATSAVDSAGPGKDKIARADDPEHESRLADAIDAIRTRFGASAVGPAALTEGGTLRVKQAGDTQWGPNQPT